MAEWIGDSLTFLVLIVGVLTLAEAKKALARQPDVPLPPKQGKKAT